MSAQQRSPTPPTRWQRMVRAWRETGALLVGGIMLIWAVGAIVLLTAASIWIRIDPIMREALR